MTTLFDQAERAKHAAIDAVEHHAPDADRDALYAAAETVLARRVPFTTEDIWDAAGGRGAVTCDGRVMGAVMRKLKADGRCRPARHWAKSGNRINHNRPLTVWEVAR